ncbi:N5-glutamine S-adenosyl-L-methionine-dependent methyltransferase (plasmid) [Mesomycoplasma conjunctivae]|nr:N5-glutamine S-adenosyl-L-methionine-dependent methyltransferase [Mesomycoplasma conjunctivae]
MFEYLLKDYNTNGGGKYAEYYTPQSIAKIMAKLLIGEQKEFNSIEIYDPSAGTGTLVMALSHSIGIDRCTIYTQDISQKSNKMLKFNLILNGLVSSLQNAIQGDTLTSPYHRSDDNKSLRQFDFVVSNPPFKLDFSETREKLSTMPERFWGGVPKVPPTKKDSMAIYTLFIQHVINSLKNETGKGAIVIPTGFITSKSGVESKILKRIVDEKIVYGCVSMPSNVFANTGTNVTVLFFDNARNHDKVILIDASKLGEDYKDGKNKKRRLTEKDIDLIINTFNNKESIADFSIAVSYDDIKEKNYSLSAGQYFDIKIDYVEITQEEFEAKMNKYQSELQKYFEEGDKLQKEIMEQLQNLKLSKKNIS